MAQKTVDSPRPARLITVEGGDGSGKSTLLARIEQFFKDKKISYILTREPGGTPVAEEIRELLLRPRPSGRSMTPLTELMLYESARADHVEQVIRPALKSGNSVLCDRFTHSSLAYQGYARGLGVELVKRLNDAATQGLSPDIVIWLKLSPADARKRMAGRGAKDRLESEASSFHEAVFSAFDTIAREESSRFIVLDASKSADDVFNQLLAHPLWKDFA